MDRFNYFLELVWEFSFNISVKADWHIFFSGVQFNDSISYVGGWRKHCVACLAGLHVFSVSTFLRLSSALGMPLQRARPKPAITVIVGCGPIPAARGETEKQEPNPGQGCPPWQDESATLYVVALWLMSLLPLLPGIMLGGRPHATWPEEQFRTDWWRLGLKCGWALWVGLCPP